MSEERRSTADVFIGLGLTLLLHLIQVPLFFISSGVSLFGIGVSQLVYVVPAIVVARSKGRPEIGKGLIIGAALTFLLNAACFTLIFPIFRISG